MQSHFNGAYVPAGTNNMVTLAVFASGPLKQSSVTVWLRSDNDQRKNDCCASDGPVVVVVSNLRVLEEVDAERRMAATEATFAWITRVLKGLMIGSIREITAFDPQCTDLLSQFASFTSGARAA